ncbi:peptidoglycan DD-metalloendopeptidase family protein [Sphingomonas sp.]|jgi:murein DD-endopeptidase MepM/ murein hydrolase activator NlpD|uniref:peptidoglycan DD-metalloendopeptidase family protein n=1 Tax=Sphingomonas sp. TaxID=28214 RepID=UPI002628F818|nr:peptidoglycan DD-metalloendopeptidase family protein [Sphingomonas sp.]MDF2495806.1 peptidase [Sphingomonas sp.]
MMRWRRGLIIALTLAGCVPPAGPSAAASRPAPARPAPQPAPARAAPLPPAIISVDGPANQGGLTLGTAPEGTESLTLDGQAVPLAPDRRFLIAFDRDAGPVATLEARLRDGRTVSRTIAVAPRAWRIERLDRVAKYPVPSAEFQRRRPEELARIAAARAIDSPVDGWRQPLTWPVTGRISGLFGAQRIYRGEPGSYHSGVDVARPTGTPVMAPADGVVVLAAASPFTLEGNLLIIDHGMGLNSAFLHLSRIDVPVGARVRQGQSVGAVGATGRASGPHLHWAMKWRDARIDPLLIAGPMPN